MNAKEPKHLFTKTDLVRLTTILLEVFRIVRDLFVGRVFTNLSSSLYKWLRKVVQRCALVYKRKRCTNKKKEEEEEV